MRVRAGYAGNKKAVFYILLLILFHFINNYVWCANDWLTMEDDMNMHLETHLLLHADLKELISLPLGFIPKIGELIGLVRYMPFCHIPRVELPDPLLHERIRGKRIAASAEETWKVSTYQHHCCLLLPS